MNPEVKEEWVKALRSGKYEQGDGRLVAGADTEAPYFCCLGVLCDVMGTKRVDADDVYVGDPIRKTGEESGVSCGYPPAAVCKDAGLGIRAVLTLAKKNDEGRSFAEIADHIEKYL